MHPKTPIQTPSFGRTSAIAGGILAAVALFQLVGVTVAFFTKTPASVAEAGENGAHNPPLKIDVSKLISESPPPETPDGLGNDPLLPGGDETGRASTPQATAIATAVAAPLPSGVPPRPTPVPLSTFTPKTNPRFNELVEQGKLLRGSGDTAGALVKFREAGVLEPGNALAVAEQAFTYEKMSLPEKAADQWRRIIAMGDRAGVYYSAARAKLETAVQGTMRQTAGGGAEIAQGKILAVGTTAITEDQDPSAAKKFTLTVPIRARRDEPISVRDLKLFVLFYERLNGKEIAKTAANVRNQWSSPPADWADGETETLEVTYELPVATARGDHRDYYGYIVRLYYRGELQDTKAEPISLNQKFPPPYTLSE